MEGMNDLKDPFEAYVSSDGILYDELMSILNYTEKREFHLIVQLLTEQSDAMARKKNKKYVYLPKKKSPTKKPMIRLVQSSIDDVSSLKENSTKVTGKKQKKTIEVRTEKVSNEQKLTLNQIHAQQTDIIFEEPPAGGIPSDFHEEVDAKFRQVFISCLHPQSPESMIGQKFYYPVMGETHFNNKKSIDAGLLGTFEISTNNEPVNPFTTQTKSFWFPSKGFKDRHVYIDVEEPFCMLAAGIQGAGKSHTMNVILENCLLHCQYPRQLPLVRLKKEMCGLVLHYDRSESNVCEAVGLKDFKKDISDSHIPGLNSMKVIVLVSASFYKQRKRFYEDSGCEIYPLLFKWSELDAQELKKLMALSDKDSQLYVSVMLNLLRGYQRREEVPNFEDFQKQIEELCGGSTSQSSPLRQRMQILQSVVYESSDNEDLREGYQSLNDLINGGTLIVADLTDPMLSAVEARSIFQVLLDKFRKPLANCGKVVAFDEAHKYLSNDGDDLSASIVETVRLMRHEGIRVLISTQSPIAIPAELLELVTFTVLHRFQSRDWFRYLSAKIPVPEDAFERARRLDPGHAMLVCARANYAGFEGNEAECVQIKVRPRITMDFGSSRRNVGIHTTTRSTT